MFKKQPNRAPFYGGLVLFSLVFFFLPNQQNVFAQTPIEVCGHNTSFDTLQKNSVLDTVYLDQSVNETSLGPYFNGGCFYEANTTLSIKSKIFLNSSATTPINLISKSASRLIYCDFSPGGIDPSGSRCFGGVIGVPSYEAVTTNGYGIQASFNVSQAGLSIVNEDEVIDKIAKDGLMKIAVESDVSTPKIYDIPATNCVKLSGDGPRKVVFMRGKSWSSNINDFILRANDVIENGFRDIDPFKTYLNQFSFYIDLKRVDENPLEKWPAPNMSIMFSPSAIQNIKTNSSCGSIANQYLFYLTTPGFERGMSMNKGGFSVLNLLEDDKSIVAIHEIGHAFAGLADEYLSPGAQSVVGGNCSKKPSSDFRGLDNKIYGAKNIKGCTISSYYRPSFGGLMNLVKHDSDDRTNVITCGYLIAAIKGETPTKSNAQKYWPECLEMAKRDTVIMDGIPPVSPTPNTTTPTTNSASAGSMVSINGSGFTSEGNAVQFTNTATGEAYEVLDISSNGSRIDFLVPVDTLPGNYTLKIGAFNSEWAPPIPFTITAVKAPVISLVASPNPVSLGDKTTITWLVQGASSCESDSTMDKPPVEWSNPGVSGSFSLALADSTEFSLKCVGPGGTASQDLQVNTTISPPLVSLSVTSRNIKVGEGVTIAWSTERAQRCVGVGGGDLAALAAWNKTQPLTGSMYLAPNQTTSLALRCTGIGGTTAVSPVASILVAPLPLSPVPISASCSVSNASGAYRQLITYTANTTGGDGKYTYNWSSADGLIGADKSVSTYYYNPTNTKAVVYKTANITVSSGGKTATAQCPSIPINASTQVSLIALPYIASINPSSGPVGAMITLTGSPNNSGLRFNSTTQQSVFVKGGGKTLFVKPYSFGADGYSLNFVLPPLPSSFGSALDIGVTSGGAGAYESNAVRFTLAAPQIPIPSITSITPSNGTLNTSITLAGKNFAADSAVLIQRDTSTTVVVPRYTPVTPPVATELLTFTFSPPQIAAGQYDIKVSNKGVLSNVVKFSNTTNIALPVVTMSITPVSGPDGQNEYTLTWGATNAVSCALAVQGEEKGGEDWSGFAGSVGVFGAITNSVTSPTTFTMTCIGPGGADSKSTTVTPEFELKSDSGNDNLANIISAFKHIFQVVFEPFINLFKIK